MIRLIPEGNNILRTEIKYHLPYESVFAFLQNREYEIKPWLYKYYDETFPGGVSYYESWTFTATKKGEEQTENSLFLNVFENELKELLKEL